MTEVMMNPKHASEAARAAEASPLFQAARILTGPGPSPYTSTPESMVSEFKTAADKRQKRRDKCNQCVAAVRDAVYSPSADDEQQFENILAGVKIKPLPIINDVVQGFVDEIDLAQRHVAALQPISDQLDGEAEQTVAKVKADLESIGSGVASMLPNAGEQPDAAASRFDFLARQNSRSRAAIQKAEQARAEYNAAVETVKQLTSRLDEARNLLRSVAVGAVTSAA